MHLQFSQLNRYLNHVANFQLRFADHVAWYQARQQLPPTSNTGTYLRHFCDHHAQVIQHQSDYQLAMV